MMIGNKNDSNNSVMNMKKYFILAGILILASCAYEDYKYDFTYTAVYFANQLQTRSFVGDEFNTIEVGVVMGGKRISDVDEWVAFEIDEDLLESTEYQLLPSTYYDLSSSSIIDINAGDFQGDLSISIDEDLFTSDSIALAGGYALPFRLIDTSLDSILVEKDSLILVIQYECRLFGNYYHNGVTIEKDAGGNILETLTYHQEEPVTNQENNWELITAGVNTVQTNGISNEKSSDDNILRFNISIDNTGLVSISNDTSSVYEVFQYGDCLYNEDSREIYINYQYQKDGNDFYANDTLILRNRILDGVNQWQF